ncbi:MAG: dynamin family protein [Methylovulum sp.]|uniref:dynamin family protein n=1 Tax=Methylovulum sp. TaxID=1916980 RepID=UPI002616F3BE|nr:dynamin family protein [Methylovulum sp.]MDD2724460.1 dynamin family protein [Methylovulum sp.]MDD5123661.1 dynamin family protein [Methylovulum sp.]
MDWKTASTLYANQLKTALAVRRHALDLANLASVTQLGITPEQKATLQKAGEPAEKLMHRLQNGEFRIAVVGLEKAGKSTFVNAWLGSDLLPAKTARCTFTTTQIYSVQDQNEQRLETLPKTEAQYSAYQADLREQTQSADKSAAQKAENDLKVMELHNGTLREIINEGKKTYSFSRLEEIKTNLSRYVADERYAHAMQEARLYTSQLAAVDGVVFYDVPGLDSGLAKHIEESKEMLADCDAIILVQRRDIDLKAHEQDLIKFGATGDPYLKLADKLFVFWGQVDLQPSKEVLQDNWQQLLEKWAAVEIPEHRIVRGSAGAHLVLQGFEIPQVGTLEQTLQKMQDLTGLSSHDELKQTTGISELQQRIQHYLDNERTALLKKRCDGMIGDILKTARDIYQTVAAVYPEDPEQAKRAQSENNTIEFSQWWHNRWQKIQADVNNRFKDGNEQSIKNRQVFKARYEELVQEKINALPSRQLEQRQDIFDSVSNPVFDAAKANIAWREKLYSDVRVMTAELARNLALELQQEALDLIAELEKQLWGSKTVKTKLVQNETIYVSLLEHSLNTLFLRFARPVVELLVRAPVGSTTRKEARKKMGADIEIIDNYYSGGEPALERLCQYANHGVSLLTDEQKRKDVLGVSANAVVESLIAANPFVTIALNVAKTAVNELSETLVNEQDTMIAEVEADIRVLEHYLIYGIFEASGFSAFCQQELDNLRDSFLDVNIRGYWTGVVQNEWQAGNPALLKELPVNLQSFKFNTETSDRLKQLRVSLDAVH